MNEDFSNKNNEAPGLVDLFTPVEDGKINPNGLLNLICLGLFFFLVLFIYLSIPSFEYLFDGSGMVYFFIMLVFPLIHLALAIFFLAKRFPQGWYFIIAYIVSSVFFTLTRFANSLYTTQKGEPLIEGYVPAPMEETALYLFMYISILYLLFRKDIRELLKIDDSKKIIGIVYGFILFLVYSAISYLPVL